MHDAIGPVSCWQVLHQVSGYARFRGASAGVGASADGPVGRSPVPRSGRGSSSTLGGTVSSMGHRRPEHVQQCGSAASSG